MLQPSTSKPISSALATGIFCDKSALPSAISVISFVTLLIFPNKELKAKLIVKIAAACKRTATIKTLIVSQIIDDLNCVTS